MRLKELFELRNGYTPSKAVAEFWDGGTIPWFRMEDIRTNGRILSDSIQHITPEAVKTASLFDANSFIMATTATIGEHAWLIADSLANQQFTNLKVRKSLIKRVALKYIFYLLFPIGESCKKNCRITTFPAVDMNEFKNYSFSLPPLAEQEAIAAYLDKECEKIGREIELLERKADSYRRLRRSLINRAVTRGLDPTMPTKPSGNDWLGDIPEHWSFERTERYFHSNTKINKDFELHKAFKFLMGTIVPKEENRDAEEYRDVYEKYNIVEKNDIIINGLNLNYDLKSMRVGIVPYKGIITSAYIVLRPYEDVNALYFNYLFKALDCRKIFHGMGKGVRLTLSFNELRTFEIPIPPKTEQEEIVYYLDEKCGKIDIIIEKIETKIERLKQLKRSLINEVVTGQRAINTL